MHESFVFFYSRQSSWEGWIVPQNVNYWCQRQMLTTAVWLKWSWLKQDGGKNQSSAKCGTCLKEENYLKLNNSCPHRDRMTPISLHRKRAKKGPAHQINCCNHLCDSAINSSEPNKQSGCSVERGGLLYEYQIAAASVIWTLNNNDIVLICSDNICFQSADGCYNLYQWLWEHFFQTSHWEKSWIFMWQQCKCLRKQLRGFVRLGG